MGMLMPKFTYLKPTTLEEACSMLSAYNGKARVIAGGTDLIVRMKQRLITPTYLVDITYIPGLNRIEYNEKGGLIIGALCTHSEIESSTLIQEEFDVLIQAVHPIGSVQVRNLGTIGGNLCNAAPSADSAPVLLGLDAKVRIFGTKGERTLELEEFFKSPGETALRPDEILTNIEIPNIPPYSAATYMKLSPRRAMDLAVVGVAVVVWLTDDRSVCSDIRIALGAVAPTPIRAKMAEEMIRGRILDDDLVREASKAASEEAKPISDVRGSGEYRKEMVEVLTRRGLQQAIERQ